MRLLVSDTLDHLVEVVTVRLLVSVTLCHVVVVVIVRLLVSVTHVTKWWLLLCVDPC